MLSKTLSLLFLSAVLISCSHNHSHRLEPEALLKSSQERVSLLLDSQDSIETLLSWVDGDRPTRAELSCSDSSNVCQQVSNLLNQRSIEVTVIQSLADMQSVVLLYDRTVASNCLPHHFGCSVSANSVLMVPTYHQFVNPNLSDPQDANMAVQSYKGYLQ